MNTTLQTPLTSVSPISSTSTSNDKYGDSKTFIISIRISFALRLVCFFMAISSLISLIISVSLNQQPLWPLRNISQYAAPYPSIYFFRIGTSISGILLIACAITFYQQRTNYKVRRVGMGPFTILGFLLSGVGLMGAGLISCVENNDVHTSFAMVMFISEACVQFGNVFCHSYDGNKNCTTSFILRVIGVVYLTVSLLLTILMASHVVDKIPYVISILEWSSTSEIIIWCWWFARKLDEIAFIEDDGFLSINRGIRKNSIENENDVHRNNYSFAYMGDAI